MIRAFRCDLHMHTCLSPCADLEMSPRALVRKSIDERLDIIAVCDHNASENVGYTIKAAEGTNLIVLPGMEVTSSEEVHVLALFESQEGLLKLQDLVYANLPGKNDEAIFGCQAIVNELDEVEGLNERLLIGATGIPLDRIVGRIHELGGLVIASHIDREGFSLLGQLGFIPSDLALDAVEVSPRTGLKGARTRFPELAAYPLVEFSDAHRPGEVGQGVTKIYLERGTLSELKMAFEKRNGRYIQE
ncbi:MAG: PHP domain-containing protein [Deltaproteobacteria bacterium]|nr:PHP domain-containing protein [Deltaproteobacteria bacterium]